MAFTSSFFDAAMNFENCGKVGDVELLLAAVRVAEHDHWIDLAGFLFGLQRGRLLLNLGFLLQRKILIFNFCVIFGYKKE